LNDLFILYFIIDLIFVGINLNFDLNLDLDLDLNGDVVRNMSMLVVEGGGDVGCPLCW